VLQGIYVFESIKSFLVSKNYAGAVAFLESIDITPTKWVETVIHETRILVALNNGEYEKARFLSENRDYLGDVYSEAVLILYEAESKMAIGVERLGASIVSLSVLVAGGLFDSVDASTLLRFVERLGSLLEGGNEPEHALSVYNKGLKVARDINDQPMEWAFLRNILRLGETLKCSSHGYRKSYAKLVRQCDYRFIREAERSRKLSEAEGKIYKNLEAQSEIVMACRLVPSI
jgi:hypothetical protein